MRTYICYCLLKSKTAGSGLAGRLWELQEYYEGICRPDLPQQAFVYGDTEAYCRPFKAYPAGWRTGLDDRMAPCRTQDLLALSFRLLESAMRKTPEGRFRLVILADGAAGTEQESTGILCDRLRELGEKGLEIIFAACAPEADSGVLKTVTDAEIGTGEDAAMILGGR